MATADLSKQPDEVAAMFDEVAPRYDLTNAVLSAGNSWLWRFHTVRAVAPVRGERILDVAAGTGTSAAALSGPGIDVVAVDFSAGMIDEGRRRHPELTFVEGDAMSLPFKANEFDAVTISFGLRNVADPRKAIAELYRVVKPGGRVVICEFSTPPMSLLRAGYDAYLKHVLPRVARLASSNPEAYAYLAESIADWPDQATLSQWLRGAGFGRVAYRNLSSGIVALHRGNKPARKPRAKPAVKRAMKPAGTPAVAAKRPESGAR